jgi:hypothetical protein
MRMDEISVGDFLTAWKRWVEYPHHDAGATLMMFLDTKTFTNKDEALTMPEDAANRLRLLLSPHHQTIIKAWYAKHENEPDPSRDHS